MHAADGVINQTWGLMSKSRSWQDFFFSKCLNILKSKIEIFPWAYFSQESRRFPHLWYFLEVKTEQKKAVFLAIDPQSRVLYSTFFVWFQTQGGLTRHSYQERGLLHICKRTVTTLNTPWTRQTSSGRSNVLLFSLLPLRGDRCIFQKTMVFNHLDPYFPRFI